MEIIDQLLETTHKMMTPGKGILAIDESMGTCQKRFDALGVECTEEARREYRGLLVSCPQIEEAVSGMILFDETIRQSTDDGKRFADVLKEKGMVVGIKVDMGAKEMALSEGEKVTSGLDGLRERLVEYKQLGAQFAKWRAVISIGDGMPSDACIKANVHALARYAALCQEQGIVPMVEPEVLIDGEHTLEECYSVTEHVLKCLMWELHQQRVMLEGCILKTSMVISGKGCATQATPDQVAVATVDCLYNAITPALGGVVFLSGGQTELQSTTHLDKMNKLGNHPWGLTFSYGRAIQQPCLNAWNGKTENISAAQAQLLKRAQMNGLASLGQWSEDKEA